MHILFNSTSLLTVKDRRNLNLLWSAWLLLIYFPIFIVVQFLYYKYLNLSTSLAKSYFYTLSFSHSYILLVYFYVLFCVSLSFLVRNDRIYRNFICLALSLFFLVQLLDLDTYTALNEHVDIEVITDIILAHIRYHNSFINIYLISLPFVLFITLVLGNTVWRNIFRWRAKYLTPFVSWLPLSLVIINTLLYLYSVNTQQKEIINNKDILMFMMYLK